VAEQNKFGLTPDPANPGKGALRCEEWEALLADALDGVLPAAQTASFEAHSAGCLGCADLLAHARQGQEWLEYLHGEPEAPSGLVSRILEKTAGAGAIQVPILAGAAPSAGAVAVAVPWRRNFHEARLLMTVAMAFFSIAVTLNMVGGGKLTSLRLADLRPSMIGNTLSRQFYGAREQVVKFYNNARFVYQLESKVRELRRDTQTQQQPQPSNKQQPKGGDKDGRLTPGAEQGEVQNAEQRPATDPQQATESLTLRRVGAGACGGCVTRKTESHQKQAEARDLNSLGPKRAGPRRNGSAGYEGRSLA
jgi:hypothetical protein